MAESRDQAAASSHACVCLHGPGYRPKRCECGVYEDEHGRWCANENCRAKLSAASLSPRSQGHETWDKLEACDCGSAQEDNGWACRCTDPPSKRQSQERPLDKDGWPARWSDPAYLGDGPWGA